MKAETVVRMSEVVDRAQADFTISYKIVSDRGLKHFPGSILNFSYEITSDLGKMFSDIFPEFRKNKESNELIEPFSFIPRKGVADMWIVSERNKLVHQNEIVKGRDCFLMRGEELVAIANIIRVSDELR